MADQKKLGASPSERKRITSDRMSKSSKAAAASKKKSNLTGKIAGTSTKGAIDKDLAKLKKMKADAKAFEKTLNAKKKAQTSKLGLFGGVRLGGKFSGPRKNVLKRM